MAAVYSSLLASIVNAPVGNTDLGGPAPGHVWVVKSIDVVRRSGILVPAGGFEVMDTNSEPLFSRYFPWSYPRYTHSWWGAQVILPPSGLRFVAAELNWSARISGYDLV